MEYARRLFSRRLIALRRNSSFLGEARYDRPRRRVPLTAQMRDAMARHRPRPLRVRAIGHRLRFSVHEFSPKLRDRSWLIRAACACAALLLLALLVSTARSPQSPAETVGGRYPSGTGSAVSPGPVSLPETVSPTTQASGAKASPGAAGRVKAGAPPASHPKSVTKPSAPASKRTPASKGTSVNVVLTPVSTKPHSTTTAVPATSTPVSESQSTTSESKAAVPLNQACSYPGLGCRAGLIYGNGSANLATAPAIPFSGYRALRRQNITLVQLIQKFGLPASKSALARLLGDGWSATLAQSQPTGDSCAYYLDSASRTGQAFQLCFSGTDTLASKAILSTSGG